MEKMAKREEEEKDKRMILNGDKFDKRVIIENTIDISIGKGEKLRAFF